MSIAIVRVGCVAAVLASAVLAASSSSSSGAILPTTFPVSQFPVPTQTSFPSPSCSKGASSIQEFTVNYNFESVQSVFPTTPLTEINVYNLLNFSNINGVNTDPDFDGNHLGLAPYTYPNAAEFSPLTSLLENPFSPGVPTITARYIESTLTSFTPQSFYYGCVFASPYSAGSLPESCNITAIGFNSAGRAVAKQNFAFAANGSVVQDQKYGAFNPSFKGIYSLSFGSTAGFQGAALIDNFIATVQQKSCAPFYTGSYNDGGASPP